MRKIVLDQFGQAWGYADVDESTREIEVFSDMTIDGSPVNRKTVKVSNAKKFEQQIERKGGYEIFARHEHNGAVYYKY